MDDLELAEVLDSDVIDHAEAARTCGWFGRVLARLGGEHLRLAWACFRRRARYDVVFTDGEQVGLPLAAFCRATGGAARHVMSVTGSLRARSVVHRCCGCGVDRPVVVYASHSDGRD